LPEGRRALSKSGRLDRPSALAILDVVMPELSGPEAYARLLELRPDLPVLFSSGYADGTHLRTQIPSGLTLLAKPFRGRELLEHVRSALARTER
jgi:FixJ family two-component response regulator